MKQVIIILSSILLSFQLAYCGNIKFDRNTDVCRYIGTQDKHFSKTGLLTGESISLALVIPKNGEDKYYELSYLLSNKTPESMGKGEGLMIHRNEAEDIMLTVCKDLKEKDWIPLSLSGKIISYEGESKYRVDEKSLNEIIASDVTGLEISIPWMGGMKVIEKSNSKKWEFCSVLSDLKSTLDERATKLNNASTFSFSLSSNGFIANHDPEKNYLIVEKPGVSAKDLRAATISAISQITYSEIVEANDDFIHFSVDKIECQDKFKDKIFRSLKISGTAQFKEGKIRFLEPEISKLHFINTDLSSGLDVDTALSLDHLIPDYNWPAFEKKVNDIYNRIRRGLDNLDVEDDW